MQEDPGQAGTFGLVIRGAASRYSIVLEGKPSRNNNQYLLEMTKDQLYVFSGGRGRVVVKLGSGSRAERDEWAAALQVASHTKLSCRLEAARRALGTAGRLLQLVTAIAPGFQFPLVLAVRLITVISISAAHRIGSDKQIQIR